MEKQIFDNKMDKMLSNLKKQVEINDSMTSDSLSIAKNLRIEILKDMTEDEVNIHKTFEKKCFQLIQSGKLKEAEELKKQYLNE